MDPKQKMRIIGIITGLVNGLFGSGGGAAAVPLLKKTGLSVKESHACSLTITLPLTVVSAVIYTMEHDADIMGAAKLIPFGIAGALCGACFMKKISSIVLSVIFGAILTAAGVRLLLI